MTPGYDDLQTLKVERAGDVLRVVIDHPESELNAVDARLHHDLATLASRLRDERTARAVLLTGRGRAFSAGGDFRWFPSLRTPAGQDHLREDARRLVFDLLDVELPMVAAVNGPAIGLGATIALLCDIILMADTAVIGDPHVSVGIVAGDGGAVLWPLALGPARAKQYLLTGDRVPAMEAERIGLVNRVVPAAELETEAMAMARRLAAGAPLAIRYTKAAVNALMKDAFARVFERAMATEMLTLLSRDHVEALDAMRDHRAPRFEGR